MRHHDLIAARTEIVHGYTLDDLDKMTHAAAIADRSLALGWADKRDIAWSAIAEALCTAEEAPHRQALIRVGWQAIYRAVRDSYRSRGYHDDGSMMPRFVMFWGSNTTPSHEDAIIERIAVEQIVDTLTPTYMDAVVALAVRDDYMRGADQLGIGYKAFVFRVNHARKQVLSLWHEGETPRQQRRTDRRVEAHGKELATRCGRGHEWNEENTRIQRWTVKGKAKQRRFCRVCDRERKAS